MSVHSGASAAYGDNQNVFRYPDNGLPFLLDDLDCEGHEEGLELCPFVANTYAAVHGGLGHANCGNMEVAGVECSPTRG